MKRRYINHHWVAVVMAAALSCCGKSFAATHTWTGPANGNWSLAANWSGGVPTSGEAPTIVQFNSGSTSNDDIAGLTVDLIHFTGSGNTINGTTTLTISGANLVVNIQDDIGGNTLSSSLPLTLTGAAVEAQVTTGTLHSNAPMGGTVGFIKTGFGGLTISLTSPNSYTGTTTLIQGLMQISSLAGAVVPGALVIGNNIDPAGSATLQEMQSSDIASTSAVQLMSSGVLDMNGFTDVVGALNGTGAIKLTTISSLGVNSDNSTSTFSGIVTGPGGFFIKQGTGSLTLTGNNTFAGTTEVMKGTLLLNGAAANTVVQGTLKVGTGFGAAGSAIARLMLAAQIADASAVTVSSDGVFDLNGFSEQIGALTVNSGSVTLGAGTLTAGGMLTMAGGSIAGTGTLNLAGDITATSSAAAGAAINCPVALNATHTFTVNSGAKQPELTLTGVIGNGAAAAGFTKTGAGTMLLQGSASNTYTGVTTVNKGVLQLTDTVGFNIPGALVIGNGIDPANSAMLMDLQSSDISSTAPVTVNASGQLNLNNSSENIGSLSGSGSVVLGSGNLTTGSDNSSQTYSGIISGTGIVFKSGTGVQTFAGANTYTGMTLITNGALIVNGSQPGSAVSVTGGMLSGTGTVGAVNVVGARIAPGAAAPGQLSTGNLTLDTNSTIALRLNNSTPSGFDSLNVTGTVSLNNCAIQLVVSPNFAGSGALTLINNDGVDAIVGTSKSFVEGQMVSINGVNSKFTYVGGTGNDVALAVPNIPPVLSSAAFASPSPGIVDQPVTFSVGATDANNDMLTYTWTFGDGAQGTGAAVMHTYTTLGSFNVSVKIDDGHGGVVNSMTTITIDTDIMPSLQINASPSTAGVGQTVTFTAPSGSAQTTLTYAWSFGDGSTGSGATVTHAFSPAGSYNVSVVVTDGLGGAGNGAATETVNAPLVGTGSDSDGDGFSDGFETAAGSDPNDPNSTPTGKPASAGGILPLTVSKASIKLNFAKSGSDQIQFSGALSVPAGFVLAAAKVDLDVSGVSRVFNLDNKGNSKTGDGSVFKLSAKALKGKVAAQTAKYSVMLPKGSFASTLAPAGLTGSVDVKSMKVSVNFSIIFNQTLLQKAQSMTYSAKKNKTGSAK